MYHNTHSPSKFSMKLLMGRTAVLVEHPGMEPQLFMPVFLNHYVVFKSVVFDVNEGNKPPRHDVPVRKKRALPSRSLPHPETSQRLNPKIHRDSSPRSEQSSHIQDKERNHQVHFEESVPPKETLRTVASESQPRRQCSIDRRMLKKQGITGSPPPFDVIRRLFYLDRDDYGSRGSASSSAMLSVLDPDPLHKMNMLPSDQSISSLGTINHWEVDASSGDLHGNESPRSST